MGPREQAVNVYREQSIKPHVHRLTVGVDVSAVVKETDPSGAIPAIPTTGARHRSRHINTYSYIHHCPLMLTPN